KKEQTEPAKEDSFQKFIGNLKDIIQKTPAENPPKQKKKESKGKVNDYVSELKRDENEEKKENQQDPENKIKNLVRKFIESEIKNFKDEMGQKIGQMGSSYGGGGSNSYNYYPGGGPMFGSLQFPNSGTGIFFADGSSLTSAKALTGGGGGGGDPAVNALVYSNSADWNAAYTNLIYNSASYLTGTAVNLGDLPSLSSNWNNTYTQYSTYSASYARTDQNVIFQNNVTILGNLTALGTATFANTIFTTTSALSVINTGPGPALYVYQAAGPYDVASFYDGDGVEVLHVGNATPGGNGFVGINESFPSVELSVRGAVSASKTITALGGNSDQWNSAYTNLIYN
ncbi:MAG: hypothetical protein EBS53_19275, partial [Bacteroidetes bacterium]|nr:hypothetical protein [Bacteroidota bacterium]